MKIALKEKHAGIIIIILHVVGAIGYMIPVTSTYFIWMTPFNLLLTTAILIWFLKVRSLPSAFILITIYLIGFISEYIGVNHQLIFGDYIYGQTLGLKIEGIPIIIGCNWIILSVIFAAISQKFISNKFLFIIAATTLMVALDFLIEPVAIHFDYWTWNSAKIPLSNYVGWFCIGGIIQIILSSKDLSNVKTISFYIAVGQLIFFTSLNVYLIVT